MNKSIIRWFVSVVDIGDSSDYKANILDSFDSYGKAYKFMKEDLMKYVNDINLDNKTCDWDVNEMRVYSDRMGNGAQWAIQAVEIPISESEEKE